MIKDCKISIKDIISIKSAIDTIQIIIERTNINEKNECAKLLSSIKNALRYKMYERIEQDIANSAYSESYAEYLKHKEISEENKKYYKSEIIEIEQEGNKLLLQIATR